MLIKSKYTLLVSILILFVFLSVANTADSTDKLRDLSHKLKANDTNKVLKLIKNGADVDVLNKQNLTPLAVAVDRNYIEISKVLLENGANPNFKTNDSLPLLIISAQQNWEIVKLLVQYGADVNCTDASGNTPLHNAAMFNQIETAKILKEKGAQIDKRNDKGILPLHIAASQGSSQIIDILLDPGSESAIADHERILGQMRHYGPRRDRYSPDLLTPDGSTPLWIAASQGHYEVVVNLLKRGASIEALERRSYGGVTPLWIASQNGKTKIVKELVDSGANLEATRPANGYTPLHTAVEQGHIDIVEYLLKNGASVDSKSSDGKTPLDIAHEKGFNDIVELLQKNPWQNTLFRLKPKVLTQEDIREIVKKHNFFCKKIGSVECESGEGFENKFYVLHNLDVVYDQASGLIWKRTSRYDNGDSGVQYNFALQYFQELNQEKFGGFKRWRMPTLEELLSLSENSINNSEAYYHINGLFRKPSSLFYSSDYIGYSSPWSFDFKDAACRRSQVSFAGSSTPFPRAVCSGDENIAYAELLLAQEKNKPLRCEPIIFEDLSDIHATIKKHGFCSRYYNFNLKTFMNDFEKIQINTEFFVKDNSTGLLWQSNGTKEELSVEEANLWIEELNKNLYAGFSNWRLPTFEEAMSLVELKQNPDSLYINSHFSNIESIWTSDRYDNHSMLSNKPSPVYVDFSFGGFQMYPFPKKARAVRIITK
ncbi:ankyrin repeat domain-containing protein [candidate division KSB1 bacterium]|nr:ankyrin repeat domain-containing protein [candidate division KSB1 bacterium]